MKIFEAVKAGKDMLKGFETAYLDTEVILCYILNKDKIYLHINKDEELNREYEDKFFSCMRRRQEGEPVSYIIGNKEFMGLNFYVKKGVLIPRPDTETLVETVLDEIKDIENPVIADVCCGSGAIGISIANYRKDAFVYLLDIMESPLEVSRINAQKNSVEERTSIMKSDLLNSLRGKKLDAIVSNPPYIKKEEIPTLMKDVRDFEPFEALCGGEDGLDFYRKITIEAGSMLKKEGLLAYEIGYEQSLDVRQILYLNGFHDIRCIKDLSGIERVVTGRGNFNS
jgi:release factor glutamine methyltransferase